MRSKAPTFDDFWKAYPLHKGKIESERAWNRLSAEDKHKALAGVPAYRLYCEQTGVAIKYPQGWLNGRRWEDEYEEAPVSSVKCQVSSNNGQSETIGDTALSDMETW